MIDAKTLVRALVLAAPLLSVTDALAASDPTGVWLNDEGRGAIEIKDCGGKLCGHVVWLRDTNDAKGCGKQIIGEAKSVGRGMWDGGWIYSPEKKRKYDVELKPLADGNLRVKGYAGTKLFSKTMIWTPAPADLARCDGTVTAATTDNAAPVPAAPAATAKADVIEPNEPRPAAAAKPKPAPEQPRATAKSASPEDETAPEAKPDEPQVAEAEPLEDEDGADEAPFEDLKNMQLGNGYGFKEVGNGKCRLKVPFVTVTVDCPE